MTVCADNLTLVNLFLYCLQRVPATSKHRNICDLVAKMIEFEHNNVTFAAIYTGMTPKVLNHELGVYPGLFYVSYTSLLDVRCTVRLVMNSHIFILTILTDGMIDAPCAVAHGEI